MMQMKANTLMRMMRKVNTLMRTMQKANIRMRCQMQKRATTRTLIWNERIDRDARSSESKDLSHHAP